MAWLLDREDEYYAARRYRFEVEPSDGFAYFRLSGVLDDEALLDALVRANASVFDRYRKRLWDHRGITEVKVSNAFMKRLVHLVPLLVQARRVNAHVIADPEGFGLVRWANAQVDERDYEVFRDVEEARMWLAGVE